MLQGRALEQAGVAAEHDPVLRLRDGEQFLIAVIVAVQAVEPKQSQVRGEPTQMHVGDEAEFADRYRTQLVDAIQAEMRKPGIDRDPLAALQFAAEAHRGTIDQDQVDLRMRHAHGLDLILDRRRALEAMQETTIATGGRQQVSETAVKTEFALALHTRHAGPRSPGPLSLRLLEDDDLNSRLA